MCDEIWDAFLSELHTLDLSEFVLSFLAGNAVNGETALGIVDKAEVFASLLNGDHIHETGGVCAVGADLRIDLDESLHEDSGGFASIEGILQSISQEHDQWHAVAEFVRTRGWPGSV
jgi:hypothetical protein